MGVRRRLTACQPTASVAARGSSCGTAVLTQHPRISTRFGSAELLTTPRLIGVMPTPALRRSCRPHRYADSTGNLLAAQGGAGGLGRHNGGVPRKARPRTTGTAGRSAPPQSALPNRTRAPLSLGAGEEAQPRPQDYADPLARTPLPRRRCSIGSRHNHEVGMIGVISSRGRRVEPSRPWSDCDLDRGSTSGSACRALRVHYRQKTYKVALLSSGANARPIDSHGSSRSGRLTPVRVGGTQDRHSQILVIAGMAASHVGVPSGSGRDGGGVLLADVTRRRAVACRAVPGHKRQEVLPKYGPALGDRRQWVARRFGY
jgi:hypothetical protein